MFTGIVEETGVVCGIRRGPHSAVVALKADKVFNDLKIGDSVAVNGICLTVTSIDKAGKIWTADVMHETLRRSSLSKASAGCRVNLERAMAANGRFGGHIVSGHIDGTGKIVSMKKDDNAIWVTISAGPDILKLVVEKGSIAIDGISLTVAAVTDDTFQVSVIPHTMKETVLSDLKPGDMVNLETDIIGKYVARLMHFDAHDAGNTPKSGGLTPEFLRKYGF